MSSKKPIISFSSSSPLIQFLLHLLVIIFLTSTTIIIASCGDGNETDHQALLKFKSMITQDPHGALTTWNNSLHFCNWSGVTCGKRHRRVTFLVLESQGLEGYLPPHVGNLSFLRGLYLSNNNFQGVIPHELGYLSRLRFLNLELNKFKGVIPYSLYNLSLLTNFSLGGNQLTGSLPPTIGVTLPCLVFFQLWGNQLTGPLPPSMSNCSRLRELDMSKNKFSGKLKINFAKLRDIYNIRLDNNDFGSNESDDMKFIDSLKNCTKLKMLYLGNCNFQGVLPRSIGNFSNELHCLNLQDNEFNGNLPRSIGNLVGLIGLYLGGNQFIGNIPSTIGNLKRLEVLYLHKNQFSGRIPDAMGNLTMLITLSMSSNMLEGVIPSSLGNCHHLIEFYLRDNKLKGEIPTQLLQLSSLSKMLDLSQNNLFGSLPTEVRNLNMLSQLDLSYNNISGNIPSSLGGCASLSWLSLQGNLFQGTIPSSLSSLKGLTTLDISHNNLSGQIPRFFEKFSLQYLNLSFNYFDGEVPMKGVFANASALFVLGNSKLCGGVVELGLPKCMERNKHTKRLHLLIVSFIGSTLFSIICFIYAWCKKKRKSRMSQPMSELFMKVSYNQLLKATNGFSKDNLIGKGGFSSVFKGILDANDDRFVAIKVLHVRNRGAHRSFIRECEAWQNIRHRNLLKIITSCSSVDFQGKDFKALVYEFMPNGSLHDWLHSSDTTPTLNLLQRISILIDVAYALDYIHNHCVPAIVHCDLKPSNVLLDDDMTAHVGDFGLTRFVGTTSYQDNSIGIRGTIGYVPPEYGLGSEMTSSGDVYSFGILLLEVMTGKKPTEDIFNEGLSLHNFASMVGPDHVTDIIDFNILSVYQENEISMQNEKTHATKIEECLASTIKIGVSCSRDSPSHRMKINTVVRELQHILDIIQNIESDREETRCSNWSENCQETRSTVT